MNKKSFIENLKKLEINCSHRYNEKYYYMIELPVIILFLEKNKCNLEIYKDLDGDLESDNYNCVEVFNKSISYINALKFIKCYKEIVNE